METAQTLLLTTDLQIQEIARRCGYTDQHYFSYCFKKYSGTSPVALRRARAAGRLGHEAPAPHRSPGGSADFRRGRGGADRSARRCFCAATAVLCGGARTNSAQVVSQVVGAVGNYVSTMDSAVSIVLERLDDEPAMRDAF